MTFKQRLGAVALLFALLVIAAIAKAGNTRVLNANTVNMESSSNAANVVALTVPSSVTPYTFKLPGTAGSSGQALYATDGSGTLGWLSVFTNPMSTAGDLIYGLSAGAPQRLPAGSGTQLLHSGTVPSWGAASLTADVTGTLPVGNGGTGLTAGTSGGVLAYTASGTLASSGALTGNAVVIGGGAGVVPTVVTNNSTATNKLLTQSSSAAPAWATLVAGDIPSLPASIITSGQLAIAQGGTNVSSVTTAPTASSFAGWDAQRNLSADNFIEGYTTTATAAATTTLTVDSTYLQYFTGSTTQTVALPVVSTLVLGQAFQVVNNSSDVVTVQSSGGNTVQAMAASSVATFTVISTSGTGASSWNVTYQTATAATVSSVAMTVPSFLSVAGSPVTTSGTLAVTLSGTALPVANGGTGVSTLASNGVLYGNGATNVLALAVNSTATNKFLTQSSSNAPAWATIAAADVPVATTGANGGITLKSPTQQAFTSGSGTYTTPAGVLWLRVRMVGGGGGGAGGSNGGSANGGTGGTGGVSTFGSSFLTANGGLGGVGGSTGPGGDGGSASLAAGAVGITQTGSGGIGGVGGSGLFVSGAGGSSPFGGAGKGVAGNGTQAAAANSGSGGSGSGTNGAGTCQPGGGGGAGGFIDVIIGAPSGSYAYAVGAAGTAGSAGSGSGAGGVGGSGYILVEEHYY